MTSRLLTGWGRTAPSRAEVLGPLALERLQELVTAPPARGLLARGAGRSYGDAAQNGGGRVLAPVTDPVIEIREASVTVRASASVTFAQLLAHLVPRGLLLPVLPGTAHLTVGGAIAADVHGKNQHEAGSLAGWVDEIELVDGHGQLRRLSPRGEPDDREAFWATAGGMGLTGIILAATLRLVRVRGTRLRVRSERLGGLDQVLAALDRATSRYSVAWVDCTATGAALGRGIVETADHLDEAAAEPPIYAPRAARRAVALPFCPVTPWSARAFNTAWFRRAPRFREAAAGPPEFFHRLDAVADWNRALGPRGFVQYQLAVPDGGDAVIAAALELAAGAGCAPFLGTLKRFGPASGAPLSFPLPGWSLAMDLPAGRPGLAALLDELDRRVAAAGGRVYLAKDARLTPGAFAGMYGDLAQWRAVRAKLDPAGVFRSDLGRRVGLC